LTTLTKRLPLPVSKAFKWSDVLRAVQSTKGRERLATLNGSELLKPSQASLKRNQSRVAGVLSRLEDWYEVNVPQSSDRGRLKVLRRQLEGGV